MAEFIKFEDRVQREWDTRVATLARIKTRSLDADVLTLTALRVLVYAQLEGGVKTLTDCIIKDVNLRRMTHRQLSPRLIEWRNPELIDKAKNAISLENLTLPEPFREVLNQKVKIKRINAKYEFNQMGWTAIDKLYAGLGLSTTGVLKYQSDVDELVSQRNSAAHQGILPPVARTLLESQLRQSVVTVEGVLTDYALQALSYFSTGLHRR